MTRVAYRGNNVGDFLQREGCFRIRGVITPEGALDGLVPDLANPQMERPAIRPRESNLTVLVREAVLTGCELGNISVGKWKACTGVDYCYDDDRRLSRREKECDRGEPEGGAKHLSNEPY